MHTCVKYIWPHDVYIMYSKCSLPYKNSINCVHKFVYDIRYIIMFYIIGDYLTTSHALGSGLGFEENGFLSGLMAEYGMTSLIIVKMLILGVIYWNYLTIKNSESSLSNLLWGFSKAGLSLMGFVLVVNNLMVIWMRISLFEYVGLL